MGDPRHQTLPETSVDYMRLKIRLQDTPEKTTHLDEGGTRGSNDDNCKRMAVAREYSSSTRFAMDVRALKVVLTRIGAN